MAIWRRSVEVAERKGYGGMKVCYTCIYEGSIVKL
jgi:hypothetical protein